jgi:hypothetical protein
MEKPSQKLGNSSKWSKVSNLGVEGLKITLPLAVFVYKFREWYNSTDFKREEEKSIPLPPPPPIASPVGKYAIDPLKVGMCPICSRTITNPAGLPTGYTFCYPCVFPIISKSFRCPVSELPVQPQEIRRLYHSA